MKKPARNVAASAGPPKGEGQHSRTRAATEARRLKPGEDSRPYRVRGSLELHRWLATIKPAELGAMLEELRRAR